MRWKTVELSGDRPLARYGPASVTVGSSMFMLGGGLEPQKQDRQCRDDNLAPCDAAMWELSLTEERWTLRHEGASAAPAARKGASLVASRGKLYLYGGMTAASLWGDVHVFDLASSTWAPLETTGESPAPRAIHAAAVVPVDGVETMLIHGGFTRTGVATDLFALDLTRGAWRRVSERTPPAPRHGHTGTAIGARMVIHGGCSKVRDRETFTNDLWAYDAARDTWTPLPAEGTPPTPRYAHTTTLIGAPGDEALLVFGGFDQDEQFYLHANGSKHSGRGLSDLSRYDLASGRWSAVAAEDPPAPRECHAAAAWGSRLYIFGGYDRGVFFGDTWKVDLADAES